MKVVAWGLSKDKDFGMPIKLNPERIKKLASGRMWVSCMIADKPTIEGSWRDITPEQDAVNNLKGAYQEEQPGSCIYVQPKPEPSQPGMRHRLRKENNFWLTWLRFGLYVNARSRLFLLVSALQIVNRVLFRCYISPRSFYCWFVCNHA